MRQRLFLLSFVLTWSLLQAAPPVITLDGSGSGRMFEGQGAMSAGGSSRLLIDYPEPSRGQILDYLFKPNYGASFQDLKVEIGGNMNSSAGAEPSHMHTRADQNYNRGYEWWLMEQAKLRNPNITLGILSWGAPGWVGNGTFFSDDTIAYIINFIQGAKAYHNLTIDYVGILNERPYNPHWIIQLKAALRAWGLTTKIVAPDLASSYIVSEMRENPALMDAVDVLGFHYPRWDGGMIPTDKPIWASEDGLAWDWNGNWSGAVHLAKAYNRPYIKSRITKHQVWSLVTSYYDIFLFPNSGQMFANTPWSGNYLVQPAIWASAHTNQFAGPGWQYVDQSSGFLGAGSYVTLKKGSDYSVIIENVDGQETAATFNIVNGLSTGPLHVWKSNQTAQFIRQPDIIPVNGSFSMTIAAGSIYSITTTTGQTKGDAVPPPPAEFPFPYTDDFENYPLYAQAKYFSAMNGSFEIVQCGGGRTGLCLRQAVPAPPIPWTTIGPIQPSTLIGNANWTNYQVSADVFFEEPATIKIMGRATGADVNRGYSYGYQVYLDQLGNWSLRQGDHDVLSSGSVPMGGSAWHTVKLTFAGNKIRVVIDGITVADKATNNVYARGMAGLGVQSWDTAQFDNFRIDQVPGEGIPVPRSTITVTATGETVGYEAFKVLDGDRNTFWNSPYTCVGGCRVTQPLPQSLTLALGATYRVTKLRYIPRQDNNLSGAITSYNVYASTDGVNFTKVAAGNWQSDAYEKEAVIPPTSASYVRLEAVYASGGLAAASEVYVEYDLTGGVSNPFPLIRSLAPNPAATGTDGFVLSVEGSNFIPGSVLRWNGVDRETVFNSSTKILANIPASDIETDGVASVTVFNPTPGGGTSIPKSLPIQQPGATPPSAPVTDFLTNAPPSGTPLRNNFTGWVGMQLTIGPNPLQVTSLGRLCIAGNSGLHIVKFVNSVSGTDVTGGSATVNLIGCTSGQFVYSLLDNPITLGANAKYFLASQETQNGDQWFERSTIAPSPDATVNAGVYQSTGSVWTFNGGANNSYVPPSFQYTVIVPTPITVTIQASPSGNSFSADGISASAPQTVTWSSGSNHVIAAPAPRNLDAGSRVVWSSWSDNGAQSHTVSPTSNTTYTANFFTQYLLTTNVSPTGAGTVIVDPSGAGGWYNSNTVVQLTAAPAPGCTFSNWVTGATNNPINVMMSGAQALTANFTCSAPPAPPAPGFISSFSQTALRNDFSGWVGMQLLIGAKPLSVTSLGRVCVVGNSSTHTVKFVNAANSVDIPGASAVVNMDGCIPGQFVYVALPNPVTLAAGVRYFLASQEIQNGDRWYELGAVAYATDASVMSGIYQSASSATWFSNGGPNTSYVPPTFRYSTGTTTPPVTQYQLTLGISAANSGTVAANPPSATGYYDAGTLVQLSPTAAANCSFVNWNGGSTDNPRTITMSNAQSAIANFGCATPPPSSATEFITGFSQSAALRNDFNGWIGMNFTLGPTALNVSSIGRNCVAGNSRLHNLKLVNALSRVDLPGSSATVSMAGCTVGQFVYATLSSPVTLAAGSRYYLVSEESQGGDRWYDRSAVTETSVAIVNGTVYSTGPSTWTGANDGASYVPLSFQYSGAPAVPADPNAPFISNATGAATRNDFTGWVGMKLTVGANPITVNSLGRMCVSANAGTHTLKFASTSVGADVPGGSAAVSMVGCTVGQFVYVNLQTPIILQPGTSYYLVSQETSGGDRWIDLGAVSTRPIATVNSGAYNSGSGWFTLGTTNLSYVPVNFK